MGAQSEAPTEAQLIRNHREGARPPISRRQAAAKTGISPSQWSDIERGTKQAGQGIIIPIRATAETLARMAQTVGVTADELAAAGRQDAADVLHASRQQRSLFRRLAVVPGIGAIDWLPERATQITELLPAIAASLDAVDASSLPEAARRDLTSLFIDNLTHDAARRHSELLLILRMAARDNRAG